MREDGNERVSKVLTREEEDGYGAEEGGAV